MKNRSKDPPPKNQQQTQRKAGRSRSNWYKEKPFADDLQDHPNLQAELKKMQDRPHPIDRQCFVNNMLISYVSDYLKLAKKMIVTQQCHYLLPERDKVLKVRNQVGRQLYPQTSQSAQNEGKGVRRMAREGLNSPITFKMDEFPKYGSLFAFFKAYSFEVVYILAAAITAGILDFSSVFATKKGLDLISSQISENGSITQKTPILRYFLMVWGFGVLSTIIQNWILVEMTRLAMRFFTAFSAIFYEKIMRVGVTNPFEHDEGSIINYIQNDMMTFKDGMWYFNQLTITAINLPMAVVLGCYLFGGYFLVIIAGILLVSCVNYVVLKGSLTAYNKWTQAIDTRLNLLKNILKNIKFIKINALENIFFVKLVRMRKNELMQRTYFLLYYGFLEFIISLGIAFIIMAFLFVYFRAGLSFSVGSATALLQIINLVKDSLNVIPGGLSNISSLVISAKRVGLFLEAKELDSPEVTFLQNEGFEAKDSVYASDGERDEEGRGDSGRKYALEIRNGHFFWDKKMSADDAHNMREELIKTGSPSPRAKRRVGTDPETQNDKNKKFNKLSLQNVDEGANLLRQTLLTAKTYETGESELQSDTQSTAKSEKNFELKNLNFRAERHKLTMIIGKIGSGKSSIINALLGEMRISDFEKTKILINGTISYQGQSAWLINGTIRDNVLLNKDYDEKKFRWALKYSALEHDLEHWDLREMHEVGESGTALSGGQRARISLARCLYQDSEIYIFDDVMSALDANVGAFITQETIIKQLRKKTVVLVTHGLQYVRYADYIYLVDQGEIYSEGTFEEIRNSELYTKFLELENWSETMQKKTQPEPLDIIIEAPPTPQLQQLAAAGKPVKGTTKKAMIPEIKPEVIAIYENPLNQTRSFLFEQDSSVDEFSHHLHIKPRKGNKEAKSQASELATGSEDRQVGSVSCSIYHHFFKLFGGYIVLFIFFAVSLSCHILSVFSSKFFEDWGKNFAHVDKFYYLKLYGLIWIGVSLTSVIKQLIKIVCTYVVGSKTHNTMSFSLLHSRMQEFLDLVPYGQIQNRFSQDVRQIDLTVVTSFYWFMHRSTELLILLATMGYAVSYQLFVLIGVWITILLKIEVIYMNCRREYNRLKAISISPLINTFSDVIKGLTYIRSMGLEDFFRQRMEAEIAERVKNQVVDQMLSAWFSMRCDLLQKFIIQLPSIIGILYFWDDIDPSNIGLFFVCIFSMSKAMIGSITQKTDWETALVSVERCQYFNKLEPEALYKEFEYERARFGNGGIRKMKRLVHYEKERRVGLRKQVHQAIREAETRRRRIGSGETEVRFPKDEEAGEIRNNSKKASNRNSKGKKRLITHGRVEFRGVSARYLSSKTDTLKDLNLVIYPGEKVGIVGRSGSGKSTVIKLFWKYMEPRKGKLLFDRQSIRRADLKSLRSQMTIITQETALFEGTVRENLDPTGFLYSDDLLVSTLNELEFENQGYKEQGLDLVLDSEGTNLSQGEKQLLCFARSILEPSKLVLFDEATANIDIKTEETIQRMVKERFKDSTMLVVAHRVQTVLECDKIIVMEQGRVQDFDTPENLMGRGDGFFKEIVEKMKSQ